MATVSFRFWYPRDFIGHAVCWKTNSDVSHCSIVIDGLEIEALPGTEVDFRAPKPFIGRSYDFELDGVSHDRAISYLRSKVGEGYDYKLLGSFIFPWVRGDERRVICSELVYGMARACGLFPEIPSVPTPYDLELLAIQRKFDNL